MSRRLGAAIGILLGLAFAPALPAQGTLSTQGLGFPPGQLSTRARTMGGSTGEADALSPLNPASLILLLTPIVAFQVEPEHREVMFGTERTTSSISRFPLFMGALPLGSRWRVALTASTLLDRTYETAVRDSQFVGADTAASTLTERSEGSISDIRLGAAFAINRWLSIGLAGHALSGSDAIVLTRLFDDPVRFDTLQQRNVIGFGGHAMSVGVLAMQPRVGAIGVSYRRGGSMNAYEGGEVVGSGRAPNHYGASLLYLGLRGSTLAVRAARDDWSQLQGMAGTLHIHEGWDIGVGADVTGPRFGGSAIDLRAGGRWRTLPFSVNGTAVTEQTWSGGFMIPMGRFLGSARSVELNFGALRSSRSTAGIPGPAGPIPVSEKSWTISTGFAVRP
jgi:hypothetical protein